MFLERYLGGHQGADLREGANFPQGGLDWIWINAQ
jgi:hypothetical protein